MYQFFNIGTSAGSYYSKATDEATYLQIDIDLSPTSDNHHEELLCKP